MQSLICSWQSTEPILLCSLRGGNYHCGCWTLCLLFAASSLVAAHKISPFYMDSWDACSAHTLVGLIYPADPLLPHSALGVGVEDLSRWYDWQCFLYFAHVLWFSLFFERLWVVLLKGNGPHLFCIYYTHLYFSVLTHTSEPRGLIRIFGVLGLFLAVFITPQY